MGLEPTRANAHKNLNLARLPIPTLPHTLSFNSQNVFYMVIYEKSSKSFKSFKSEMLKEEREFIILVIKKVYTRNKGEMCYV